MSARAACTALTLRLARMSDAKVGKDERARGMHGANAKVGEDERR